jgi:hemerythrin-like domain-containing protein
MKPTDILKSEHRVIERVLTCLERIMVEAESAGRLDGASAEQAIDFFRSFADGCHHSKEEDHLFPAVEAKGVPRAGGPTGVMLHEHELGRKAIAGMAANVRAASEGDGGAIDRFVEYGRSYVDLLRQHIDKEDHILFAMADRALTDDEQGDLAEDFEHVEAAHRNAGTQTKFLRIAEELAERYDVPESLPNSAGAAAFCCGH